MSTVDANAVDGFTEEVSTEVNNEQETQEIQTQQESQPVRIPYKFLGKEGDLSLDEARPFIEKGMNYDHKNQQYESLVAEYNALKEQLNGSEVTALIEKGYDEDTAKELVALRQLKAENDKSQKKQNDEKALEENKRSVLRDFESKFPGVDPKDWTPEMHEAYAKGESVIEHYKDVLLQKEADEKKSLLAQLEALKGKEENANKSVGSVTTNQAQSVEPKDAFLQGFLE